MSAEKKQKLQAFLDEFAKLPTDAQVEGAVAKYNQYWPFMKAGLAFLESRGFTGKKLDDKLEALIEKGDALKNDPDLATKITGFISEIKEKWEKVRGTLEFLVGLPITGEKFDEAVTKFIDVVDDFVSSGS